MLEIRTLGGFSISVDGKAFQGITSRKAQALLIYLLSEGRPINRNVLATLFWPESSQIQASTSLRVLLTLLRRELGAYLDISRNTVSINPNATFYLDSRELEEKLLIGQVEEGLDLYKGDFLEGFYIQESAAFEDWLICEQERVKNQLVNALREAIIEAIDDRNYVGGISLSQKLLAFDPLDELAHQQTMVLYALNGERTTALAQYEQCKTILQEELDAEPSTETQILFEKIVQGAEPTSLIPAPSIYNLPAPQTSFIGRKEELRQVTRLLRDPTCRLISIVGPGGCGKTRLALKVAGKTLRAFPNGTFFINVETCHSGDFLITTIANDIHFNIDTVVSSLSPKLQLWDYLRNRSILIVLDGFEHLTNHAVLLSEMLAQAPKLKLLVTSRQRLDLKGEWVFPLEGLPIPKDLNLEIESDALRLFIERSRQVIVDYQSIKKGLSSHTPNLSFDGRHATGNRAGSCLDINTFPCRHKKGG